MILKGSQRGGAKALALHLLRADENEHVEVHELRGFVSDDLTAALKEVQAISRGTKCRQFLFSLSLSPPPTESVPIAAFEDALEQIEAKLGLENQPRAVVFHEKEGRRHAHVVWSRIDAATMTARNLPHFKLKLRDVSRALYLEHGWTMPRGLVNSREADPANFSREEWQQAKRAKEDPRAVKEAFLDCWAISDSRAAFAAAMAARGYCLACGDRRGFVALDYRGEVYSVTRWTDLRTKEVKAKLGDPKDLPSVTETRGQIAQRMSATVRRYIDDAEVAFQKGAATLGLRRADLSQRHRDERRRLTETQEERWQAETLRRSGRLAPGLRGIWDFLTGKQGRIRRRNEWEAWQAARRDQAERDAMIERQLTERRDLQADIETVRRDHTREKARLHQDIAFYLQMPGLEDAAPVKGVPRRSRGREHRGQEPELGL